MAIINRQLESAPQRVSQNSERPAGDHAEADEPTGALATEKTGLSMTKSPSLRV